MFDNCELSHPLVISVAFTLFIIIRTFNLLECSNTSLASSLYMKRHKNKHCKSFWCLTFGSLWRVFSMRNAQISANFHFYWKTFLWDCEHWRFRKHINILYGMKNLAMRQAKFFSKSLVFSGSCTKQRSLLLWYLGSVSLLLWYLGRDPARWTMRLHLWTMRYDEVNPEPQQNSAKASHILDAKF